jgi:hypothetical protein
VDVSAKGALERTIQALRVEKEAAEEKIESEKAKLTQLGEDHSACERERVSYPLSSCYTSLLTRITASSREREE